jgi:hypothetical protein
MRTRAAIFALLIALVALSASATAVASSKEYVLKHPKHEHCRSQYVKKAKTVRRRVHGHTVSVHETVCVSSPSKPSPSTKSSAKPQECTTVVSGTGPVEEMHLYAYQVIFDCAKGEYSSFQVSTNRTIVAGSVSARLGGSSSYNYTCTVTSSTSFSCSGVNAAIPSNEAPPLRAFFKSAQPVCEGTTPESATITMAGETFKAVIGEIQGSC